MPEDAWWTYEEWMTHCNEKMSCAYSYHMPYRLLRCVAWAHSGYGYIVQPIYWQSDPGLPFQRIYVFSTLRLMQNG